MIAASILWMASIVSANGPWRDSVFLDTLAIVEAHDTLRIQGPAWIVAGTPSAGILVRGTLLVAGDDSDRVEWTGGKGIEVASGAQAYFAGYDQSDAGNGLHVSGGRATVWDSRLQARRGRPAAILSRGELVIAGSRIVGNSAALVGWQGVLELDDVVLRSDTLWRLDPKVEPRFQDLDASDGVRIGQNPLVVGTHAAERGSGPRLRWLVGPSFGTRAAVHRDRRDVMAIPLHLALDFGSRYSANLLAGWRSGWLDNASMFNERDQTLARLQARISSFLDLGLEAGYGGTPIDWNMDKAELAMALLDRSMDMEVPFVAPGPLAGGRAMLHGRLFGSAQASLGVGYQWRGSSGSVDLGDVVASWGSLSFAGAGRRTEFASSGVWCLPDRTRGVDGADHWQWTAQAEHRRNLAHLEWGFRGSVEGLDGGMFSQRMQGDVLWGSRMLRMGPAVSGLLTESDVGWGGAAGPGARLLWAPTRDLRLDAGGFVRVHRDVLERTWYGGDVSARISGGF